MAAHLLAARSLLTVRINKCQHLVVDKIKETVTEKKRIFPEIVKKSIGSAIWQNKK
jgi:hypothetical protein